ncbi:MAG: hypothetical protein ABI635_04755 [Actinomycetota bacterium]
MQTIAEAHPGWGTTTAWLARMLVLTGDIERAQAVMNGLPGDAGRLITPAMARSDIAASRADWAGALQELSAAHGSMGSVPVPILEREMVLAAAAKDVQGFRTAYEDRGTALGTRTFGWIPIFWVRYLNLFFVASVIAMLLTAGLGWFWVEGFVLLLWLAYLAVHKHVLRSRALTIRAAIVIAALVPVAALIALVLRSY